MPEFEAVRRRPSLAKVRRAEMAKPGCRSPLNSLGIWIFGPAQLKFGIEEQQRHDLP